MKLQFVIANTKTVTRRNGGICCHPDKVQSFLDSFE